MMKPVVRETYNRELKALERDHKHDNAVTVTEAALGWKKVLAL